MTGEPAGGGRARIGREEVLVAAEAIVDRLGWDGLTMSALARELGVKAPSLYHHVEGIDAVRGELQARTMASLAQALRDASVGRSGAAGVCAQAEAQRAFALRHRHRYEGFVRATIDPPRMADAAVLAVDVVHRMLASAGVPDRSLEEVRRVLFVAHHGFIALESAGFFPAGEQTDELFARVLEGSVRTIEAAASEVLVERSA